MACFGCRNRTMYFKLCFLILCKCSLVITFLPADDISSDKLDDVSVSMISKSHTTSGRHRRSVNVLPDTISFEVFPVSHDSTLSVRLNLQRNDKVNQGADIFRVRNGKLVKVGETVVEDDVGYYHDPDVGASIIVQRKSPETDGYELHGTYFIGGNHYLIRPRPFDISENRKEFPRTRHVIDRGADERRSPEKLERYRMMERMNENPWLNELHRNNIEDSLASKQLEERRDKFSRSRSKQNNSGRREVTPDVRATNRKSEPHSSENKFQTSEPFTTKVTLKNERNRTGVSLKPSTPSKPPLPHPTSRVTRGHPFEAQASSRKTEKQLEVDQTRFTMKPKSTRGVETLGTKTKPLEFIPSPEHADRARNKTEDSERPNQKNRRVTEPENPDETKLQVRHSVTRLKLREDFGRDILFPPVVPQLSEEQITRRFRRSLAMPDGTPQTYTVELLMVVDYAIYKKWYDRIEAATPTEKIQQTNKTISQYFAFVLNGIDLRFDTIKEKDFNMDVTFAGLVIVDDPLESYWTEGKVDKATGTVDSSDVLDDFWGWVNTSNLPSHDHVMLFTGYDLTYGGSVSNAGLAYSNAMCSPFSVSVVEETFDFRVMSVAAHELGHSLGARHDMDGNICLSQYLYIMTPRFRFPTTTKVALNPWKFSSCSIRYFREYISQMNGTNGNCLTLKNSDVDPMMIEPYLQEMPGSLYDADTQCRYSMGNHSYVCRDIIGNDYSSICNRGMQCFISGRMCSKILPGEGTPCGNKKVCLNGTCTSTPDAPALSDSCPFGDQPVTATADGRQPCTELISSSVWQCYQPSIRSRCCQSCGSQNTGVPGCEYGDHNNTCQEEKCASYDNTTLKVSCCFTCRAFNGLSNFTTAKPIAVVSRALTIKPKDKPVNNSSAENVTRHPIGQNTLQSILKSDGKTMRTMWITAKPYTAKSTTLPTKALPQTEMNMATKTVISRLSPTQVPKVSSSNGTVKSTGHNGTNGNSTNVSKGDGGMSGQDKNTSLSSGGGSLTKHINSSQGNQSVIGVGPENNNKANANSSYSVTPDVGVTKRTTILTSNQNENRTSYKGSNSTTGGGKNVGVNVGTANNLTSTVNKNAPNNTNQNSVNNPSYNISSKNDTLGKSNKMDNKTTSINGDNKNVNNKNTNNANDINNTDKNKNTNNNINSDVNSNTGIDGGGGNSGAKENTSKTNYPNNVNSVTPKIKDNNGRVTVGGVAGTNNPSNGDNYKDHDIVNGNDNTNKNQNNHEENDNGNVNENSNNGEHTTDQNDGDTGNSNSNRNPNNNNRDNKNENSNSDHENNNDEFDNGDHDNSINENNNEDNNENHNSDNNLDNQSNPETEYDDSNSVQDNNNDNSGSDNSVENDNNVNEIEEVEEPELEEQDEPELDLEEPEVEEIENEEQDLNETEETEDENSNEESQRPDAVS